MSANEYIGWQTYFEIYPFTQDREDARIALLAQVIANMSGKSLKNPAKMSAFLPTYIKSEKAIDYSLEQQRADLHAFKQKLLDVKGKHSESGKIIPPA